MNSKQTYLAWVRTRYPKLYWQALTKTFNPKSGLSGLGDDLTDSISPDLSVIDASDTGDLDVTSDVTDAVNSAYNATLSPQSTTQGGTTDFFTGLANAINSIAPTVVQTEAAQNLLQINTQRAQLGLPLYSSNGQVVTSSMLSPTSASIAQMEAALSGSGGMLPLLLIGGGLLLFAMASKKS
jgi:hypothetical protein